VSGYLVQNQIPSKPGDEKQEKIQTQGPVFQGVSKIQGLAPFVQNFQPLLKSTQKLPQEPPRGIQIHSQLATLGSIQSRTAESKQVITQGLPLHGTLTLQDGTLTPGQGVLQVSKPAIPLQQLQGSNPLEGKVASEIGSQKPTVYSQADPSRHILMQGVNRQNLPHPPIPPGLLLNYRPPIPSPSQELRDPRLQKMTSNHNATPSPLLLPFSIESTGSNVVVPPFVPPPSNQVQTEHNNTNQSQPEFRVAGKRKIGEELDTSVHFVQ
jgi:hypothetical protein